MSVAGRQACVLGIDGACTYWHLECRASMPNAQQLNAHKLKVNGSYKRNACVSSKASVNSHFISLSLDAIFLLCLWMGRTTPSALCIYYTYQFYSLYLSLEWMVCLLHFQVMLLLSHSISLIFIRLFPYFDIDVCETKHSHGSQMHSKIVAHRRDHPTLWSNLNFGYFSLWLKTLHHHKSHDNQTFFAFN